MDAGTEQQTSRRKDGFSEKAPVAPGQLTINPQAIVQLCAACHIGSHAAVTPGVRKAGSLDVEASPISRYCHPCPGRDGLVALEPGDIWRREERGKDSCWSFRICWGRGIQRSFQAGRTSFQMREASVPPGKQWGWTRQCHLRQGEPEAGAARSSAGQHGQASP